MTDTRSNDSPSVIDRTHEVAAEGSVIAAYFLGRTAAFILSEEAIVLAAPDGEPQRIGAHGGAQWAVAWTADADGFLNSYCNTIPTPDGGTHESGLRTALTRRG